MQRALQTIGLFGLLGVIALRPMVAESYTSEGTALTAALERIADPSPIRTLVFDLVILFSTGCVLLAGQLRGGQPFRRTGLEVGMLLIAVAGAVSCVFASNQRLAINATVDWLCYPLLTLTLVQLLHASVWRRVVLAVVLASASAQALDCFEEYFQRHAETLAHYESIRDDLWHQQGVALDSSQVALFEQRIAAREAQGFFPHSNVAGAYLVLCGLAALGLAVDRARTVGRGGSPPGAIGALFVALALLVAVPLTKSLGALLSLGLGVVAGVASWAARRWLADRRTKAFVIVWCLLAIAGGAFVAHGLSRGEFPHMSLTFRWHYWTASAKLFSDHALTGVGRENFGGEYLAYKSLDSPEEIANPHNFLVQAACDWGALGLAGMTALLLVASWTVARVAQNPVRSHGTTSRRSVLPWLMLGATWLIVVFVRARLLGSDEPNFVYYSTVTCGLAWLVGALFTFNGRQRAVTGEEESDSFTELGVAVGLLAFLVHELINFALFVPGSATTFFALLAVRLAPRSVAERPPAVSMLRRRLRRAGLLVGCAVTVTLVLLLAVVPTARCDRLLRGARKLVPQARANSSALRVADELYAQAAKIDLLDPTAPLERGRFFASVSVGRADERKFLNGAVAALTEAVRRDPHRPTHHRALMRANLALAREGDVVAYRSAMDAGRAALRRYPLDPPGIAEFAEVLHEAGNATHSSELLHEAIRMYDKSLALDDARPGWERLRRFPPRQRAAIQEARVRAERHLLESR